MECWLSCILLISLIGHILIGSIIFILDEVIKETGPRFLVIVGRDITSFREI